MSRFSIGTELIRLKLAKSLYTSTKSKFLTAKLTRSKWINSISSIEVTKNGASYNETRLDEVGNIFTFAFA